MAFKTGRSRTITIHGNISGEVAGVFAPSPGLYKSSQFYIDLGCLNAIFQAYVTDGTPPSSFGPNSFKVTVQDSDIGSAASNIWFVPPHTTPNTVTDFTATGTWSVTVTTEEWCEVYGITSGFTTINGTDFPNYGGAAQGDGLPGLGVQFFELTKPGTTKTSTITFNGVTSAVTSASITGGQPISTGVNYGVLQPCYGYVFVINVGAPTYTVPGYTMSMSASSVPAYGVPAGPFNINWPSGNQYATMNISNGFALTLHLDTGATEPGSAGFQAYDTFVLGNNGEIDYTINARLRAWGSPYPGSQTMGYNGQTGGGTGSITLNPTGTANIAQQQWYYSYHGLSGSTNTYSVINPYISTTPPTEDSRDWRLQFRGFKWDAFKITRSGNVTIDDCTATTNWTPGANTTLSVPSGNLVAQASGGAGSLTLAVPHPVRVWEAFRYLQISGSYSAQAYDNTTAYTVGQFVLQSSVVYECIANCTGVTPPNASFWSIFSGPVNLTATLASQTWPMAFADTDADYALDLCCAGNETATKNKYTSRFPIKSPGGGPINTDPTTQYEMGWGVDYCDAVAISGIPDGINIILTNVILTFAAAGGQKKITIIEPFLSFESGWSDPSDNTTVQQFSFIQTDGRVSDVGIAMALVSPIGAGSPSYTYLTVSELISYLQYLPGLTVTSLTAPTDGFHGFGQPGLNAAGSGSTYDWSTSAWKDWIDVDMSLGSVTVPVQDLFDEVQVYPGCGNPWTPSGLYNIPTPLFISKLLRGQAWGEVFKTNQTPNPSQSVVAYLTSSPTTGEGSAITAALGDYLTGSPWGNGNLNITTECRAGTPALDEATTWQNRLRTRSSFRQNSPPPLSPMASWGRPQQGWGYVASTDTSNVYINRYIVKPDTMFTALNFQADALAGNWASSSINQQYLFYVEHGDTDVKYVTSQGFEDQWGMPTTITSGTDVKSYYSKELDMTMCAIFTGAISGTGDWQAWTSVRGGMFALQGTILSGVMNNGATLVYEEGPIKQWRFAYNDTSTITTVVSQDAGQNWS